MPELAELPRRERQPHRLAVDQQLAVVGLVEAREDLDQRRLARAVLPEEAVHLPGEHAQVDAAKGAACPPKLFEVEPSRGRSRPAAQASRTPRLSGSTGSLPVRPQIFW